MHWKHQSHLQQKHNNKNVRILTVFWDGLLNVNALYVNDCCFTFFQVWPHTTTLKGVWSDVSTHNTTIKRIRCEPVVSVQVHLTIIKMSFIGLFLHMPSCSLGLPGHRGDISLPCDLAFLRVIGSQACKCGRPSGRRPVLAQSLSIPPVGQEEKQWLEQLRGFYLWTTEIVWLTSPWAMLAFQAVLQRASVDVPSFTLSPGWCECPHRAAPGEKAVHSGVCGVC